MSYKVLTRKKRPKLFDDVMGHEGIISSLKRAITSQAVGHAYVFSGTRGIGKTSAARIFAKALCCENRRSDGNPCLTCSSCISIDEGSSLNVMEIDGASHNGVDHVRQLVDGVSYLPSQGLHRVYIIDEVHMLSTSAFNALLKTLEEPPAHAVFILATTEPEKIPATVLSRCQKYNFKLASLTTLKDYLKKILTEENIEIENDKCLEKLIALGQGSFRDTLSLVDQIMSMNGNAPITEDVLWTSLGIAPSSALMSLTKEILEGNAENISTKYKEIISFNVDLKHLSLDVLDMFFNFIQKKIKNTQQGVLIDLEAYESVELFWIYETLMKDLKMSLESLDPVSCIEIVFLKCGMRREFFKKKNSTPSNTTKKGGVASKGQEQGPSIQSKPTSELKPASVSAARPANNIVRPAAPAVSIPAPQLKPEPVLEKKLEPVKEQHKYPSWDGFIAHAFSKNPAIAANLEQGNLVGEIKVETSEVSLKVGFPNSGRVFWDYLSDVEVKGRLLKLMASYFKKDESQISLELALMGNSKTSGSFKTQAQIYAEKDNDRKLKIEDDIKENDMVNYAEKIFSSKVERVDLFEQ
jgi:DNA polymerase-3 subunit gamma/tau